MSLDHKKAKAARKKGEGSGAIKAVKKEKSLAKRKGQRPVPSRLTERIWKRGGRGKKVGQIDFKRPPIKRIPKIVEEGTKIFQGEIGRKRPQRTDGGK